MGIPDLRLAPDPYIGFEDEYVKVAKLVAAYRDHDFASFIDFYYRNTPVVPRHQAEKFTRSLLAGENRARHWLAGWEQAAQFDSGQGTRGSLLDIGCGTAPLLVAARQYRQRAGVDVALRWLIVARKRLEEAGQDVPLICASAEALPIVAPQFDVVALDSALEHFADQTRALEQVIGLLRPGGWVFVATPNRYSIGPDPHTGIPAGSLLPESWTAVLVRRQGGIPPKRRLLSYRGLRALLRRMSLRDIRIYVPGISEEQRRYFSRGMRLAASAYDVLRRVPGLRWGMLVAGPLLHAVARRVQAEATGSGG